MGHIKIAGLTKHFSGNPPATAIDELDLEVDRGEFLVLLGPSGCGKTTTLRCLAGLETPDKGRISFGDRVIFDAASRTNVRPDKRDVGMVFQSYALWPHMTIRKNIAYPLKARHIDKTVATGWLEETCDLVNCRDLLDRYPGQLSGGQQQRVALARGLVARPDVVLFDEPLSNLDARLRDSVRAQLHELHQRLGFTAVFVTHDQSEALALGDRIAIMRNGKVEQLDSSQVIFDFPATEYVASFIGMSNRLEFIHDDGMWSFSGGGIASGRSGKPDAGSEVVVRLRPDDLLILPSTTDLPPNVVVLPAEVVDSTFGGRHIDVVVSVSGGSRLQARVPRGDRGGFAQGFELGQRVTVGFSPEAAECYDSEGRRTSSDVANHLLPAMNV